MSDPNPPDPAAFVESAWRDQATWSDAAGQLKASLDRWRATAAVAGALGALLNTAAGTIAALPAASAADWAAWRAPCAIAGTLLLALVPYVLKCSPKSASLPLTTANDGAPESPAIRYVSSGPTPGTS